MSTTKKQAKEKIQPLLDEIDGLEQDLKLVKTPSSILALKELIEHRSSLVAMWKRHAGFK